MNYLKIFENYHMEQPLEKEDIYDLFQGTGIDIYSAGKGIIRKSNHFYLGWLIVCSNADEFYNNYNIPKNYIKVFKNSDTLHFIWNKKVDTNTLLYNISNNNWKNIKNELNSIFNKSKKVKSSEYSDSLLWMKNGKILLEYDKYSDVFIVSYEEVWKKIEKFKMTYMNNREFLWIYLEDLLGFKASKCVNQWSSFVYDIKNIEVIDELEIS
jgi:hypothetical protein